MFIRDARDIERLIALDQQDQIKEGATFFEIIGRSYDENLVSRMLSYTLQKDAELVNKLLARAFGYEVYVTKKSCICEKAVPSGRIDIFVEAEDETGCKYTLTIENKTRSWEHDDQTKKYYDFIFGHGMFKETSFTNDDSESYISKAPIWNSKLLVSLCKGPIVFGHIHTSQIIRKHIYYTRIYCGLKPFF